MGQCFFDMNHPLDGKANRKAVTGEHDMMGRILVPDLGQEKFIFRPPTPSGIRVPLTEQERSQPLACPALLTNHVGACVDWAADSLVLGL